MVQKYTLYDIRQWKKRIRHLNIVDHLTKQEAYKVVEKEFGVPVSTVQHYTAPSRYKLPSASQKNVKEYNTLYVRVKRHIDDTLRQVFADNSGLPLKEISNRINKLKGICFRERTLEKLLAKYEGRPRGPPVVKTETENYKLNPSFYNS